MFSFHDSLAIAYLKSGDLDNARKRYETIALLSWGRLFWGSARAKSAYMLGRINEQQGNTAKAIEHYAKFLDLRKDANPGLPDVEDASGRLEGLMGRATD